MESGPILTLAIPTYNRAEYLGRCLEQLGQVIPHVSDSVRVLISDNSSSDSTARVCEEFLVATSESFETEFVTQPSNLGGIGNLLWLYENCGTQYMLFIGDDDAVSPEGIIKLVEVLNSGKNPSIVIQSAWDWKERPYASGFTTYETALEYFYEFGNAYAGCLDVRSALAAVAREGVTTEIEQNCWSQTLMGYLAAGDLYPERRPYLMNIKMGRSLTDDLLVIQDVYYYARSLHDLIIAAKIVDLKQSGDSATKAFISFNTRGFRNHISALVQKSVTEKESSNHSLKQLIHELLGAGTVSGMVSGLMLWMLSYKASRASARLMVRVVGKHAFAGNLLHRLRLEILSVDPIEKSSAKGVQLSRDGYFDAPK